jgi:hypothetical protein
MFFVSEGKNCPSLCLPTAVCKAAALRDVQLRYNLLPVTF